MSIELNEVQVMGCVMSEIILRTSATGSYYLPLTIGIYHRVGYLEQRRAPTLVYCCAFNEMAKTMAVICKRGQEISIRGKIANKDFYNTQNIKQKGMYIAIKDFTITRRSPYQVMENKKNNTIFIKEDELLTKAIKNYNKTREQLHEEYKKKREEELIKEGFYNEHKPDKYQKYRELPNPKAVSGKQENEVNRTIKGDEPNT